MDTKEIKYEKRMVLYLDILGFKNAVNRSVNDSKLLLKIHKALKNIYSDRIKNYSGPLKGVDYGTQVSVFSDNIVLSEPYGSEGSWFSFLYAIYWLINEILWDGFLVRGAISIGELYHDEQIVFGPALNEAYENENNIANYPRVIFTKETLNEGLKTAMHKDMNEERKVLSNILEVDEDGLIYINNITKKHEFDYQEDYIELLFKVKRMIEIGLKSDNLKVVSKYEWLKSKYNNLYNENMDSRCPGKIPD